MTKLEPAKQGRSRRKNFPKGVPGNGPRSFNHVRQLPVERFRSEQIMFDCVLVDWRY